MSEREPDKAASDEQKKMEAGREKGEKNEKRNRVKSHLEGDGISRVVKEVTEDET